MLCNKLYFAILTLALSYTAQAAPQGFQSNHRKPETCPPPVTVTVTARGGAETGNNLIGNSTKTASAAGSSATLAANNGDPQKSLTLDPKVIGKGFENNGQNVPTPGQVASLTSSNNFINFCLTVPKLPITNGKQIATGSCNPAPMGIIPSVQNMVAAKFVFPTNFGAVKANTAFTIKIAIQGMNTGFFVNAEKNYYAAPQQVDKNGRVNGHSHVVVEKLKALDQTTPTDPTKFVFFKGLNNAAAGGILSVALANGLPEGVYRASTINTAANHQPFLAPVAQHGSFDDHTYFQVTKDGKVAGVAGGASASNSTASATGAASATGEAGKGAGGKGTATGADTGAKGAATSASTNPAGKGAQPTPPAQKANNSNVPATPTPAKSSPTTAGSPGAKGGKTN